MKTFKTFLIISLVIAGLVTPRKADAGIPTIDVSNLIQSVLSVLQQIEEVSNTYYQIENQIKSYKTQMEELKNMNGDYLKHALLNSSAYKDARRYLPESYSDLVDLYKTGNAGSYSAPVDAAWAARDDLKGIDAIEAYGDDRIDSDSAIRHQNHESNMMASVGAADMSYKRVDELLEETEALMADMSTTVDAKAAADLNNRFQAQTQFLLAEIIRVQSTQATTEGRKNLYEISQKAADKKKGNLNELPKLSEVAGY